MRPSTPELLDSIAAALEAQVQPALQDKWAASTLRSATQLLRFLALRVQLEPQVLREQATDLRATLTQLLPLVAAPALADLRSPVQALLAESPPALHELAAIDDWSTRAMTVVETMIAARDRLRDATGSSATHELLLESLLRQLERERALVAPFQSTPPI